jgi:hypothetical protein
VRYSTTGAEICATGYGRRCLVFDDTIESLALHPERIHTEAREQAANDGSVRRFVFRSDAAWWHEVVPSTAHLAHAFAADYHTQSHMPDAMA